MTVAPLPSLPMTVVRLEVDSFKRLRAAHVEPLLTGLVPVRGRNEAGKSSLIEAMLAALLGKAAAPELPIHEGAHGARVELDLGGIVVERRWTRDSGGKAKTSLVVRAADGTTIASPQAVLDQLVGRFADPVAFLEMRPEDQVKTTLAVLGLAEHLEAMEARAATLYDRRRDLGRDSDRLTKAEQALAGEVSQLPPPVETGSAQALAEELQSAKDYNAQIETAQRMLRQATSDGMAARARVEQLRTELARADLDVIAQRDSWNEAKAFLADRRPVPTEPIVARMVALQDAQRTAGKREQYLRTKAEAETARGAHTACDIELEQARASIGELLAGVVFPVAGMAYDAEAKRLTIGGIPFSQASQAQKLKVAAAVAMAGKPPIRVLFARDGSLLDDESRAQLADMTSAAGFQLWLEVVDSKREGAGVYIENGEVQS